ncbi:TMEM33 [Cordylochernes scorpioides]|uniref:TMEM33 n=1 Tax=Cordylochernes scorpioides TaxID=51811 RepID=A0ABY6L442_9ARAC|nr:TMEM33 [Cordylochernes scorpioides]
MVVFFFFYLISTQITLSQVLLQNHLASNKIEACLLLTRMGTMLFTFLYIISFFGVNPYSCYYKALLSNAATSALRLHQRLPRVELSQNFLARLLLEDSLHYLGYSIIFLSCQPFTSLDNHVVLFPVFLFALLHTLTGVSVLTEKMGVDNSGLLRFVEREQRKILKLVSYMEIFLMPLVILMTFQGKCSLVTPFFYYQFLASRYASRRNPYTRTAFQELRLKVERIANQPTCPALLSKLLHSMVRIVSRLSPVQYPPS